MLAVHICEVRDIPPHKGYLWGEIGIVHHCPVKLLWPCMAVRLKIENFNCCFFFISHWFPWDWNQHCCLVRLHWSCNWCVCEIFLLRSEVGFIEAFNFSRWNLSSTSSSSSTCTDVQRSLLAGWNLGFINYFEEFNSRDNLWLQTALALQL